MISDPCTASRSLFGRDADRSALSRAAARAALVTVTGPPGVGKTALLESWVADGNATWIDLTPCQDADDLEHTLLYTGAAEADRLVLDNCEHLVDDVVRWLLRHPHARVVCGSRISLDLPHEVVVQIDPLQPDAATRMLRTRMRARSARSLDDEEVGALVARSGGLPLALELIAWQVRSLPFAELQRRLDEGDLTVRRAGVPPHHNSLRRTLERSWRLLDPDERAALCQASVFAAPFSPEAADAIVHVGELSGSEACARLVPHSLLQPTDRGWRMLVSVRAFAQRELAAMGPLEDDVRRRHAYWFAKVYPSRGGPIRRAELRAALPFASSASNPDRRRMHLLVLRALSFDTVRSGGVPPDSDELWKAIRESGSATDEEVWRAFRSHAFQLGAEGRAEAALRAQLALQEYIPATATPADLLQHARGVASAFWAMNDPASAARVLAAALEAAPADVAPRPCNAARINYGYSLAWLGDVEGLRAQLDAVDRAGAEVFRTGMLDLTRSLLAPTRAESLALLDRGLEVCELSMARAFLQRTRAVRLMVGGSIPEQQAARASLMDVADEFFAAGFSGEAWLCVEIAAIVGDREAPSSKAALPPSPMILAHIRLCQLLARALDHRGMDEARAFLRDEPLAIAPIYHPLRDWLAGLVFEHDRHAGLVVSASGTWFEHAGAARVDLTRRPVLQRLFTALVGHHRVGGQGMEPEALIRETWPDQHILPSAARNRLRVAVSGLRALGLGYVLENVEGRYRLDPGVHVLVPPPGLGQGISTAPTSHQATLDVPH